MDPKNIEKVELKLLGISDYEVLDMDIDLLRELHQFGVVRNLRDRRHDVFSLTKKEIN